MLGKTVNWLAGITLALGAMFLVGVANADAAPKTYCINSPAACPAVGDTSQTTLTGALAAAQATPADADVVVCAGPEEDDVGGDDFKYDGTTAANGITIQGSGPDQTTLTQTDVAHPVLRFVTLAGPATENVRDLTISMPDGFGGNVNEMDALQYPTQAENVRVVAQGAITQHAVGVASGGNATFTGLDVRMPLTGPSGSAGIAGSGPGTLDLTNSAITAQTGIMTVPGVKAAFAGLRVHAGSRGIYGNFSGTPANRSTIENSQILLNGTIDLGITVDGTSADANLAVRGVTLKATGATIATGLYVFTSGTFDGNVNVRNSIVTGVSVPVQATASGSGTITVTVSNSVVPPGGDLDNGPNVTIDRVAGTNAEVVDPVLVDAGNGDLHPRFDSPAIDRGSLLYPTLDSDLAGQSRIVEGDGAGFAEPDAGAFEYQRRPPVAAAAVATSLPVGGSPIAFTGAGSDPDPGDTLTYSWLFSDSATSGDQSPSHVFGSGPFSATLTVHDPTGLTASSTLTGVAATPPDTTPPVVSNDAFSPRTFRASADSDTATSARTRTPVGSTLKFTLSEASTVTIVVAQKRSGRTKTSKGKTSCVAETKILKKAKKCTYYTPRATLTRKDIAAGARTLAFTGRVKGKALPTGSYLVTITAQDAARNTSKALTTTFALAK